MLRPRAKRHRWNLKSRNNHALTSSRAPPVFWPARPCGTRRPLHPPPCPLPLPRTLFSKIRLSVPCRRRLPRRRRVESAWRMRSRSQPVGGWADSRPPCWHWSGIFYAASRAWRSSNVFDRQYRFPEGGEAALRFGATRSGGHMATIKFEPKQRPHGFRDEKRLGKRPRPRALPECCARDDRAIPPAAEFDAEFPACSAGRPARWLPFSRREFLPGPRPCAARKTSDHQRKSTSTNCARRCT